MSRENAERKLARCQGFDIGIQDHGLACLHGAFTGDGWGQGLGLAIDIDFVKGLLAVFGVDRIAKVNGRPCWILADHSRIYLVEPLMPGEGKAFDVDVWMSEATQRALLLKAGRR